MSANGTAEENTTPADALSITDNAPTTSDAAHANGADRATNGDATSPVLHLESQSDTKAVDTGDTPSVPAGSGHAESGVSDTANASPRPTKSAFNSSPTALQDMFLNGLRRENIDVVIYFCDGSQERGAIRAFDTFTVLLENRNSGKAQLIYKHAISRIFPTRTPSQLFSHERTQKK